MLDIKTHTMMRKDYGFQNYWHSFFMKNNTSYRLMKAAFVLVDHQENCGKLSSHE